MSGNSDQRTGAQTRQFFQQPSEAGWTHFVERYGPKIYDWCRRRLNRAPGLVDDAAQAVVVNLFRRMKDGRKHWDPSKGSLHAWLRTVARNACHDALAKDRPALELREEDGVGPDMFEEIALDEVRRLAREGTQARVSEKEWLVFRLTAIEGLSGEQAAEKTGLGIGTVYNYRSKATRVYQQELTKLAGPEPL